MNPSVKRLLLQSPLGKEQLLPLQADAALMIFISVTALLILRKRDNGHLHRIDSKFTAVLIPYGATVGIASANFTLGKYIIPLTVSILSTALLALYITRIRDRKKAYLIEAFTGITSLFLLLAFSPVNKGILQPSIGIIVLGAAAFAPVYIIHRFFLNKETGLLYLFPILTHLFDASSTFIAIQRGLTESQLLARKFISILGPEGIFIMKFVTILPISVYMGIKRDEKYFAETIYLIGIYGLVLAFRNLFLILSAATAA